MNKFRYPLMADRIYTLTYENFETEVLGQQILDILYRGLYLDELFNKLYTDNDHMDIGEL